MEKYQKNILVVCLGNINRSPAVEYLLKEEGFINVKSCGLGKVSSYNRKMTKKMQTALGISFPEHRSQQINQELVDWADIIIVQSSKQKKKLLNSYSCNEDKIHAFNEVADPYHTKDYSQTALDLKRETKLFISK